jgi:hypothetical protein
MGESIASIFRIVTMKMEVVDFFESLVSTKLQSTITQKTVPVLLYMSRPRFEPSNFRIQVQSVAVTPVSLVNLRNEAFLPH